MASLMATAVDGVCALQETEARLKNPSRKQQRDDSILPLLGERRVLDVRSALWCNNRAIGFDEIVGSSNAALCKESRRRSNPTSAG